MSINYQEKIPNNVDLAHDRRLQRALEHWQPHFIDWWKDLGPEGFMNSDVYLRTAVSVDAKGWAHFGKVKMPEHVIEGIDNFPKALITLMTGGHMGKLLLTP